jgi:chromosomal replication initiator protein
MHGDNGGALWEEVLGRVQERLNGHSFETWFRPLTLGGVSEDHVEVLLPNRFFKEWFEEHYLGVLQSTLEEIHSGNGRLKVVLRLPEGAEGQPAGRQAPPAGGPRRGPRRGAPGHPTLNPKYTFETFVVGSGNRFAHAAALAVAEQPSRAYNPLFFYGGVGLGKTHLLHAIGHFAQERNPDLKLSYLSSERFTNDLINAIRFDATVEFRRRYRHLDLLLIDDIQFIAGKERTQEEFFHTFNDLYESSKQIVISSDSLPREIPTLEERLRSRFEWGLIADIQPPDLETKAAILRRKAQAAGLRIPDEVSLFIANRVKSNIRELEGSLVRVIAFASLTGRELNLPLAQEVLQEFREDPKDLSVATIQRAVADAFHVEVEELKSKSRSRSLVTPRQIAMFLLRTLTHRSLPDIGRAFGGRDHTTVIHACEKVKGLMEHNAAFRKQVEQISSALTG